MKLPAPAGPWRARRLIAGARIILVIAALCAVAPPAHAGRPRGEYEVKAAFLYNFAHFVTWPEEAGSSQPIVIGIVGEDPFGTAIDRMFAGKPVNGRPLVVRRFSSFDQASKCHILFVGAAAEDRIAEGLRRFRREPVLTVGESEHFVEDGGVIRLKTVANRVRFDISVAAADSAHIKVSSRLLQVADVVRGLGPAEEPR